MDSLSQVMVTEFYSTAYVQKFTLTSGHCATVNHVSFSPNGNYVASGGDDNTLNIWSLVDGSLLYKLLFQTPVDCLLWHPRISDTIIIGCQNGLLFQSHDFSLVLQVVKTTRYHRTVGIGQEVHITHEQKERMWISYLYPFFRAQLPREYSGDMKIPAPPILRHVASDVDQRLRAVAVHFHKNGTNLIVSYLIHGIMLEHRNSSQLWTIVPPIDTPQMYCPDVLMEYHFRGSSALSPDGRNIIVYNLVDGVHSYVVGSFKKQMPRHQYKFDVIPRSNHALKVAYLHAGRALVCGTTTGNICIWNTASKEYFQLLGHNGVLRASHHYHILIGLADDTILAIDASILV
ncbi:hypothetical protein A0H81_07119 [Grifola frondosa]|uniref:Uncharacterized protein n=1 Tax=Grifola frondosa TaxID=5627 RepID=A0A1C7MEL8_GRIFR|nr:hypothetical protein A0H81_07119 [Grifola frondosa]